MLSKPTVREYLNEHELIAAVNDLKLKGIDPDDMYVLAHDKDRTKHVADRVDANTIGLNEEGITTTIKNLFLSTGDELRNKMEEMGLSNQEANEYERKLDEGKILLIV